MIPGSNEDHPTFKHSFGFAIQGFRYAFRSERNIKVMCFSGIAAIILGLIVQLDFISWALLFICCGCVIAAELINTAIEAIVDLVSPEFHPLAGRAKDIAAGAVWVLSLFVAIAGIIIFSHAIITNL